MNIAVNQTIIIMIRIRKSIWFEMLHYIFLIWNASWYFIVTIAIFYPLFKCCCLWIGRNVYLVTKNHLRCRRWLTDLGMKFVKDSWFSKFFKCIVTQIRDILILFKGAQIDTEKCYQVDLYLHVYKTFWSTVYVANSFYDHRKLYPYK